MDRKGIMGEKWLRYKVCLGFGKVGQGERCGAVECEIEVLYDILAWGVLEKMKMHPSIAIPAKVQKAGLHILRYSVQCRPAWAVHVARRLFTCTHCIVVLYIHYTQRYSTLYCTFILCVARHIIRHIILRSNGCIYNYYIYNYQYILYYIIYIKLYILYISHVRRIGCPSAVPKYLLCTIVSYFYTIITILSIIN